MLRRKGKQMSGVTPVHREMTVREAVSEVRSVITAKLVLLEGKIVLSDDADIECDFGSLLWSRLLGKLWVSNSALPKKATIKIEDAQNGLTRITIDVRDTHWEEVKLGYVRKYEQALEELSDSILSGLEDAQGA